MICPACKSQLSPLQTPAAELDYCVNCKGVWFDDGELKKFDNPQEFVPPVVDIPATNTKMDYSDGARKCPRCEDGVLCARSIDIHDKVEIDQCLSCSGIWLDGGEIAAVRALYPSEEERKKSEDAWLAGKLAETKSEIDANIGEELVQIEANRRTLSFRMIRAIAHLFNNTAFD